MGQNWYSNLKDPCKCVSFSSGSETQKTGNSQTRETLIFLTTFANTEMRVQDTMIGGGWPPFPSSRSFTQLIKRQITLGDLSFAEILK